MSCTCTGALRITCPDPDSENSAIHYIYQKHDPDGKIVGRMKLNFQSYAVAHPGVVYFAGLLQLNVNRDGHGDQHRARQRRPLPPNNGGAGSGRRGAGRRDSCGPSAGGVWLASSPRGLGGASVPSLF